MRERTAARTATGRPEIQQNIFSFAGIIWKPNRVSSHVNSLKVLEPHSYRSIIDRLYVPFQFGCSWLRQHIRGQCPRKLKPRLRIRVTEIRQEEQCHVTHSVVTIGMDNPFIFIDHQCAVLIVSPAERHQRVQRHGQWINLVAADRTTSVRPPADGQGAAFRHDGHLDMAPHAYIVWLGSVSR